MLGRTLIFMTIVSFLFVGLIINLLQVVLLIGLKLSDKPQWRTSVKRLNGYLLCVLFSPTICLLYYWSRLDLDIQLADLKLIEDAKKPLLAIMLPNHSYELDYMVCFALADQLGNMGSYKSMSKDELKYLPVVGWCLWMSDIIFLKRRWQQDKKDLGRKLNELYDYDQMILGIFAEGTRWSPEKQRAAIEFAKSRSLEPLQHHLLPRTRGFIYTLRHYLKDMAATEVEHKHRRLLADESLLRLFNLEIIMPDRPTFGDFIEGRQLRAHIYCEEIELSRELRDEAIESRDEDDCPKLTRWLHDVFVRKDQIVDQFYANGHKFTVPPEGGAFPMQRSLAPLVIWLLGFSFTWSLIAYLAANSAGLWSAVLVCFLVACAWMMSRIDHESRAKHSRFAKSFGQQQLGRQADEPKSDAMLASE